MKQALYAGSFDPWTFGHQYILESALEIFDCVHVVSAINLAKKTSLKPEIRARIIAHAIDPFCDWWSKNPPFCIQPGVVVTSFDGLIADYAEHHNITHLIRGLRSTTDFESEFNMYFSNQAIKPNLRTWALMCPPELLHCSSTYVKTVVGRPNIKFVGTHFISQALMLENAFVIGQLFDIIEVCSKTRFDVGPFNLDGNDISVCLQLLFSSLVQKVKKISKISEMKTNKLLENFLKLEGDNLRKLSKSKGIFPNNLINELWAILALCVEQNCDSLNGCENGVTFLLSLSKTLGKTSLMLFDEKEVLMCYLNLK